MPRTNEGDIDDGGRLSAPSKLLLLWRGEKEVALSLSLSLSPSVLNIIRNEKWPRGETEKRKGFYALSLSSVSTEHAKLFSLWDP